MPELGVQGKPVTIKDDLPVDAQCSVLRYIASVDVLLFGELILKAGQVPCRSTKLRSAGTEQACIG